MDVHAASATQYVFSRMNQNQMALKELVKYASSPFEPVSTMSFCVLERMLRYEWAFLGFQAYPEIHMFLLERLPEAPKYVQEYKYSIAKGMAGSAFSGLLPPNVLRMYREYVQHGVFYRAPQFQVATATGQ